jgi:ABC-type sugar transport system ATPase subunit
MESDNMELLSVSNLTQYFGAVPALVDVTFAIEPGEVLGVVGQRGAGKSTLFQLLSGVYSPSIGEITFAGKRVELKSVPQAQQMGIVAVHQYPQLLDNLNVLHNVFLGHEICGPSWLGFLPEEGEMLQATRDLLATFDMPPDLAEERTINLSDEQKQVVALARALCRPIRLLLLDDALGALSFARQQTLLNHIRELTAQKVSVIMSSDDLNHIFAVTDYILVLYQGRKVALRRTSELTPREIVELIVGSRQQDRVTPVIWAFENYHAAQQQAEEL